MQSDTDTWLRWLGERFMREIGLREGQTVLDFSCGTGAYVLPAARLVGPRGRVYALEANNTALRQLEARLRERPLDNVELIPASGERTIPLGNETVDVVLLYDVLRKYDATDVQRELLREIHRICKAGGLFSIYLHRIDWRQITRQVEAAHFRFQSRLYQTLLHNGVLTRDHVINFRKAANRAGARSSFSAPHGNHV